MTDNERLLEILEAGGQFGELRRNKQEERIFSPCLYMVNDPYKDASFIRYSCYKGRTINATPEDVKWLMNEVIGLSATEFMECHGLYFVYSPDNRAITEMMLKNLKEGYKYFHTSWSKVGQRNVDHLDLFYDGKSIEYWGNGQRENIAPTPEALEEAIYRIYQQDPDTFVRTHDMAKTLIA